MNSMSNRSRTLVLSLSAAVVFVSGCANMSDTQRNSAIGAGLGGLAGVANGDTRKATQTSTDGRIAMGVAHIGAATDKDKCSDQAENKSSAAI